MAHKIVLDTHPLVWYLEANPRLSAKAKTLIDDPESELILPLIALAEAAYIVERGRTSIPTVDDLLVNVQGDPRVAIYPVTWEVFDQSLRLNSVPELHDRLIMGTVLHLQSLGHTALLLTKDANIIQSNRVTTVW